jgi:8-oxo-dGTP diphosphatase
VHDRFVVIPAAYVVFLRPTTGAIADAEVLLQLRRGTGYMDEHWATVAGHVEKGESVLDAAVREASEEVGVHVSPEHLVPLCSMHRTGTGLAVDERVDWFFSAVVWSGDPVVRESAKCADLRWFPLDSLPDPVVPHERRVLECVRAGAVPPIMTHGF